VPEQDGVVAIAQEVQHCIVDFRQRKRFLHGEFSECERTVTEHSIGLYHVRWRFKKDRLKPYFVPRSQFDEPQLYQAGQHGGKLKQHGFGQ